MATRDNNTPGDVTPALARGGSWWKIALPSAVIVAAVFIYYWAIWRSFGGFVAGLDDTNVLFCDFVRHYYTTARQVLLSATPAPGYFYSVFFAITLIPLGKVTPDTAVWLWGAIQVITAALLLVVGSLLLRRKGRDCYYLHLALFLLCLPVLSNFKWGQVSLLMVLCGAASLYSYQSGRKWQAGIVLALGAAIKYYPGLFLLYFLFKRDVRAVTSFIITLMVLTVGVPWATLGWEKSHDFQFEVNRGVGAARDGIFQDINSQYFANVLYRQTDRGAKEISTNQVHDTNSGKNAIEVFLNALRAQAPRRPGPLRATLQYTGYGILALNLLLLASLIRMKQADEPAMAFALLFASLPLIVETSWPHYFVYLPLCQVILYAGFKEDRQRWAKVLGMSLLAASMILSSTIFFHILGDWRAYSRYGALFAADALVLLAIYVHLLALWLGRRSRQPAADLPLLDVESYVGAVGDHAEHR
jgi:hypothetical protein